MWIRIRFDIGWNDLLAGAFYCVGPGRQSDVVQRTKEAWSQQGDFLIALSVRSAFDLALRSLQLDRGSEVLISAITVPAMVEIVRAHGLVPVPVDTDSHGKMCLDSLRQSITPQARMLVVAHLFGETSPMDSVLEIAQPHNLIVVEDCAQSFQRAGNAGHPASDLAMFSFGPIKTATALGGAVVRVASPELRIQMSELAGQDPTQSRFSFAKRIVRFSVLKFLSGRQTSSLLRWCVEILGIDFDSLANSLGRGFLSSGLLRQIRQQPSIPLLRLLRRRWKNYDLSRICRRVELGRRLDALLNQTSSPENSYWVYPLFAQHPLVVRDQLRAAGFDATCQTRMTVVEPVDELRDSRNALLYWSHVVFLPWYPDMPDSAVVEMAEAVKRSRFELIEKRETNSIGRNSESR